MATGQRDYSGDYQRIVDDIRNFLAASDQQVTDRLRTLADAYGAACEEINERLRRCHEHLRKNLWTEAIQLADAEPNLIEATAILATTDHLAWEEITTLYQLTNAPTLLMDVYEELNEAYNYHLSLDRLLIRHRRLALQRAPLRDRLTIMRTLSEQDERAAYWEEDVVTFERALMEEFSLESRERAQRLDEPGLQSLLDELKGPDWHELPPSRLIRSIEQMIAKVKRARSEKQLPVLTEQLEAHWNYWANQFRPMDRVALQSDSNWQTALSLLDVWFAEAEQSKLLDSDPLYQRVVPIDREVKALQQEIADTQQLHEAMAAFEAMLEKPKVRRSQLQAAREEASRWMTIPLDLEERYRKRMKTLWFRDHWEKLVGIAMFLIVVTGFIVFALILSW